MPANVRSTRVSTGFPDVVARRPPTVVPGDVLWAAHVDINNLPPAPSGWTTVRTEQGFPSVRILRRTATANDPSSWHFNGGGVVIISAVYDSDRLITPRVAVSFGDSNESRIDTPSVTPAAPSHLELRVAAAFVNGPEDTTNVQAPSGYSLRGWGVSGQAVAAVASRQITSSTGSGVKTFRASPSDMLLFTVGITISIASADNTPDVPPPPPITPGVGEALYRYVFRQWDGTYLDDLDLKNVRFDKRILQPGALSATIPIPNRETAARVARVFPRTASELAIGPGVITCLILRAGVPWGEYWITGAQYGRSGTEVPSISIRGSTLEAYLNQVELQEALAFEGEDQIDIARTLIEHMQAVSHADLGLILQRGTSGVTQDRTYNANEATYGQRLLELAEVDNGFEWRIDIVTGGSDFERHWKWGAPRIGTQTPPPHVFNDGPDGGDVLAWSEELDALRGGTAWRARGGTVDTDASATSTPLMSSVHLADDYFDAGWPRLDRTINRSTVTRQSTLEKFAAYWAATAPGVLRVDSVTIALGAQPSITPNHLGDAARIHFDNQWHLPHWKTRRIIGIAITPTSGDDGKETAQLVLEGQEAPS